jgi:hypothetical protein
MVGPSIPALCETYLGALWGVVLLASVLWVAYVLATRVTGAAGPSVRWCAAAVLAYWLLETTFLFLATAGIFRLRVALPLWVAAAAATPRLLGGAGVPVQRLRADVATLRDGMRRLRRWPAG